MTIGTRIRRRGLTHPGAISVLALAVLWACRPVAGRADQPRGLTARAVSARAIRLQWQGGVRGVIDRKTPAGAYERVAEVGADQSTYLDGGLAEGTAYTYRLRRAGDGLRYDFGPGGSPAKGYVRVRLSDAYTPRKGYGIVPDTKSQSAGERHRGGRTEPKLATLVWRHPTLTFVQDLPDGEYLVSLACGDATYEGSASVTLNGRQVVGLTKTGPGKFVTVKDHPVKVSGGKLTVRIGGHGRINCLAIRPRRAKTPAGTEATATTLSLTASPGDTAYYVDPEKGNDGAKGTSPEQAWNTAARVNALKLAPGDRILFKAGREHAGPLTPSGSGADGKPIVIDRYGKGADPVVAGGGEVENTIRLHNQHHWEIRNLTVTNTDGGGWDDQGRKIRRAVYVTAEDAGDVEHIRLKNLDIRDVRGMYRFAGHQTNGGIICQVTGKAKKTRFVDLRIEGCTFRTKSIDRYPVVVTSSWKKAPACEVVWKNNTLDHAGRAHIVIPADQWPRKLVYYLDPEVRKVFPLAKTAAPVSPLTGRVGCEDVMSEIAARLRRAWHFYEPTRLRDGEWLFKHSPTHKEYSLFSGVYALGTFGELRCMGFTPPWEEADDTILKKWIAAMNRHIDPKDKLLKGPSGPEAPHGSVVSKAGYVSNGYAWQLRNRVFMAGSYVPPVGSMTTEDFLRDRKTALKWLTANRMRSSWITRVIHNHVEILESRGLKPNHDGMLEFAHEWLESNQHPKHGYWINPHINAGLFKIMISYQRYGWPINRKKEIVDYVMGHTRGGRFHGSGCSLFDPMHVLAELRLRGFDYRSEDIDAAVANSALTILANWDEKTNWWKGNNWSGKHNFGAPLNLAPLLLDQPYMKISTIYNWREGPMITRGKDGRVKVNKVIYQTKGFPFGG